MLRYRDLSIQHKISVVIMVGMFSAILVAVINFISFDHLRVKQSLLAEMQVLAKITAARSGAGVMFGLDENAVRDLEALSLRSTIQKACMYRIADELNDMHSTTLFSSYYRDKNPFGQCSETLQLSGQGYIFNDALTVESEILYKDKVRGYITITSDLSVFSKRQQDWLYTGALVIMAGLLVAFLMTRRMQRAIVYPIVNLANVMDEIKRHNDLTLRAQYDGEDEVGRLVESFNNMLDIIYRNNLDLDQLYKGLVEKSAEAEETAASLEVSNNHIKDVFGSAAHDLRQPLQAMSIFSDALIQKIEDDEQKEIVRKLRQAMNNLNDLFNEILDISRYDFDLNIVGTRPTPIAPLLSKVILEFEAMAEAKGLKFRFFSSDYVVVAHAALLERIIRNLLSNAIKYTDSGGVLIGCRRRKRSLVIEVWDSGRGIPQDKIDQMFIKFVQFNESGWEQRGGYGLGLAIVKKFVDSLNYQLDVRSEVGVGSVFRLTVPLADKDPKLAKKSTLSEKTTLANKSRRQQSQSRSQHAPKSQVKKIQSPVLPSPAISSASDIDDIVKTHIILIDDDHDIREGLKLLLQQWDMSVSDFSTLESMVDFLETKSYPEVKLIISDYQLGTDQEGQPLIGDKVVSIARKFLGEDVPTFIISAASDEANLADIEKSGFHLLRKPLKPARLRAMINHLLKD